MGVFDNRQYVKTLHLREDYKLNVRDVPVDEMAPDIITKTHNNRRQFSWLYIHDLVKPIYGFPGVKDGTPVMLTTERDVRFDPCHQLGKDWDADNIRKTMHRVGKEQQHKVEEDSKTGAMARSSVGLAVAAVLLVLGIVIIGAIKYWGGA